MSEEEIDQIRTAGILHDVGKVGVADAVLLKPARLTDDEFLEMQRHSTLGRDIVAGAGMPEIAEWVLYLHERWDGRGYPDRLEGDDIPLASRVLGVADAFEAMTSSRLYRRGMAVEKALAELEKSAGQQFDPTVAQPDGRAGPLRRDPARRDRRPRRHPLRVGRELGVRGAARGGGRAGAQRARRRRGCRAAPSAPARGKASSARANSAS